MMPSDSMKNQAAAHRRDAEPVGARRAVQVAGQVADIEHHGRENPDGGGQSGPERRAPLRRATPGLLDLEPVSAEDVDQHVRHHRNDDERAVHVEPLHGPYAAVGEHGLHRLQHDEVHVLRPRRGEPQERRQDAVERQRRNPGADAVPGNRRQRAQELDDFRAAHAEARPALDQIRNAVPVSRIAVQRKHHNGDKPSQQHHQEGLEDVHAAARRQETLPQHEGLDDDQRRPPHQDNEPRLKIRVLQIG
jgi:hypothetical protein